MACGIGLGERRRQEDGEREKQGGGQCAERQIAARPHRKNNPLRKLDYEAKRKALSSGFPVR
jgi:hypothetical protein